MESSPLLSRRRFIQGAALTAGALAAPTILSSRLFGANAPSKQIAVGVIGVGNIAQGHLNALLGDGDCRVVAVCDVDATHLAGSLKKVNAFYGNSSCRGYADFRELNRRPDIDAVFVCTPDHWHALTAIDAIRNGKHVYVEKPLTLTVREGQALVAAARKHQRIGQTGTQQRSSADFRHAADLIRNGRLGKLERIDILIPANNKVCPGTWSPEAVPKGLDWNFWLGPAPARPFTRQGCHYNFRFISDYARGQITNWGTHYVDIAQWALDMDESGPVAIEGHGMFPSSGLFDNATFVDCTVTYASGVPLNIRTRTDGVFDGNVRFSGDRGWIDVSRSRLLASSPELLSEKLPESAPRVLVSKNHHTNFFDAIKAQSKAVSELAIGHRTNTVCILADIAMRMQGRLQWDPAKEVFVGNDKANRLLGRAMRGPWSLV